MSITLIKVNPNPPSHLIDPKAMMIMQPMLGYQNCYGIQNGNENHSKTINDATTFISCKYSMGHLNMNWILIKVN